MGNSWLDEAATAVLPELTRAVQQLALATFVGAIRRPVPKNSRFACIVGGSLASSVYGIPRVTQDVDLVAVLSLEHIEPLTMALAGEFHVDGDMIADAIKRRTSFNVVHLATMFMADVFVPGRDSWTLEELKRGRTGQFDVERKTVSIRFASPEDTL